MQTAANTTTKASLFLNGASSDVTFPTNGMLWYNSTTHTLDYRDNSFTYDLLASFYFKDGTLSGNRTVTGNSNNLSYTGFTQINMSSSISQVNIRPGILNMGGSGDTVNISGLFALNDHANSDANYTWASGDVTTQLAIITADRTLTLPSASQGRTITIMNQNTFGSGFKWNVSGNLKDGNGNTLTSIPNGTNYFLQGDGLNGNWVVIGTSDDGTFVVESSAASATLSTATDYVFNGTTTTWTLPLLNAFQNKRYRIKNAGSGNITLNAAGSDHIYDASSVTSISITPGTAKVIVGGPSFFYVE